MIRVKILAAALLFFSAAQAQEKTMSLQQCINNALSNNITVKQSSQLAQTAAVNHLQAKQNLLPDLNAGIGYGFNQGRNVDPLTNNYINQQLASSNLSLNSQLTLFNGMRLQNIIRQNKLTKNAAEQDLEQAKNDLTLNVILSYLQVLSNDDLLAINTAQAAVTKKQVERMTVLVNEGVSAGYLLADLKGQLANDLIAILNTSASLQQSKLTLCQLMNITYDSSLQLQRDTTEIPESGYAGSSAELYQASLQRFALIKANELKIKAAAKGVLVSKSGYFPVITLFANLGSSYSSLAQTLTPTTVSEVPTGSYVLVNGTQSPVLQKEQNYSFSKTGYTKQLNNNLGNFVGINMSIPLFNKFQTKNNVTLAKIRLKTAELEGDNSRLLLKQNIDQAYLNMNTAFEKYKVLTEQAKDFDESFRAAEVRFNTGVINAAEYLISKNNADRSKTNLSQAKYEYLFRTRVLDYYKGL
jgi:outer membrane protein